MFSSFGLGVTSFPLWLASTSHIHSQRVSHGFHGCAGSAEPGDQLQWVYKWSKAGYLDPALQAVGAPPAGCTLQFLLLLQFPRRSCPGVGLHSAAGDTSCTTTSAVICTALQPTAPGSPRPPWRLRARLRRAQGKPRNTVEPHTAVRSPAAESTPGNYPN